MISTTYTDEFNEFWQIFDLITENGLGTKGNKKRAYLRYQQKKIEPQDFDFIRKAVENQVKSKLSRRAAGMFDPDFMQVEGWINNERWDDEISAADSQLCEADRRRRAELQQYLSGDVGESVARADCPEAPSQERGGNVIDLRVLAKKL